jgi:monovalent cation:H+ antiporter-2, CPA2 family
LLLGVPLSRVLHRLRDVRSQRYQLMRGFFHGATDEETDLEDALHPRLYSIMLEEGAAAVGKDVGELNLGKLGVEVKSIRRRNVGGMEPDPAVKLQASDVLVLLGRPEELAAAEIRLLQG